LPDVALGSQVEPAWPLFPVLIALLIPIRLSLERFFDPVHLAALDADEESIASEDAGGGILGA